MSLFSKIQFDRKDFTPFPIENLLAGDLDTLVVEAQANVGAVGQTEGGVDNAVREGSSVGVGQGQAVGIGTTIVQGLGISRPLADQMVVGVSSKTSVASVAGVASKAVERVSSIGSVRVSTIVEGSVEGRSQSSSSIDGGEGSIDTRIQQGISISLRLSISITLAKQMGDSSISSKSSGVGSQTSVARETSSISKSTIRESCVIEGSVVGSSNNSSSIGGCKGSIGTRIQQGISISISFGLSISKSHSRQSRSNNKEFHDGYFNSSDQ